RACSIASNTARACWPPGASFRCTAASWQASRNAIASACPRTIAASRSLSRRGGSGRRALPPASPGRSAAKLTSRSFFPAIARRQMPTARLNGSVGASLLAPLALMLDDMAQDDMAQDDMAQDDVAQDDLAQAMAQARSPASASSDYDSAT